MDGGGVRVDGVGGGGGVLPTLGCWVDAVVVFGDGVRVGAAVVAVAAVVAAQPM